MQQGDSVIYIYTYIYIYVCILFFGFSSVTGYYKVLNIKKNNKVSTVLVPRSLTFQAKPCHFLAG